MDELSPLLIVNPTSGRGRARKLMPIVEDELRRLGTDVELRVSGSAADPPQWADDAAADGRRVIVLGGDGLVGAVLSAVAGRTPVGIIPGGTGNDFARTCGISLDPRKACEAVSRGRVVKIDAGRIVDPSGVRDDRFFCIASAGFDGVANGIANRMRWLRGTPAYVAAVVRTLIGWHPANLTVEADGERIDTHGWFVAVGNGKSYGGGMKVCPGADLHDGMLDVTILEDIPTFEFLRTFPKVFKGTHVEHPKVRTLKARSVTIDADRPFRLYADGEERDVLPATLEAVPAAADVLVPSG